VCSYSIVAIPASCTCTMSLTTKIHKVSFNAVSTTEVSAGEDFVPIDIPDRLQDDHLIEYFRIRFDIRKAYLRNLRNAEGTKDQKIKKKKEADRIEKELTRIEALKSTFVKQPENDLLAWNVDRCRFHWKNHAKDSVEENLKTLEERVEEMDLEKDEEKGIDEPLCRSNWERQILNKVKIWDRPLPPPPKPKIPEEEKRAKEQKEEAERKALAMKKASFLGRLQAALCKNEDTDKESLPKKKKNRPKDKTPKEKRPPPKDSYGLTVTKITLRKCDSKTSTSTSFMNYDIEKYPLDQCLFKTGPKKSPLSEKCEPDTIRYFHIPANNMQWIEVRPRIFRWPLALMVL